MILTLRETNTFDTSKWNIQHKKTLSNLCEFPNPIFSMFCTKLPSFRTAPATLSKTRLSVLLVLLVDIYMWIDSLKGDLEEEISMVQQQKLVLHMHALVIINMGVYIFFWFKFPMRSFHLENRVCIFSSF